MSDFCRFFHPPGSGYSADQQFIGATKKVSSYEYSGKFYDSGEFRLVMRTDRNLLKKLSFDTIVFYDGDTHIVEDIETHGDETILSGMDLKGIVKRRKAVFNANIGYDGITGTTAECIEHYINNNFINTDDIRKMPIVFNANGIVGIAEEAYMAKMDDCGEIVKNLCYNAGIGYTVEWSGPGASFVFKLLAGLDRSMNQSIRPRIIFSTAWKNVKNMEFNHISSNCYNAIYSEDVNKVIRCHYRNGVISGLSRKECLIGVDADTAANAELAALEAVKDNDITHSYKVAPATFNAGEYSLGDIVSVRDPDIRNIFNGQITEIQKSYSAGQKNIEIVIGTGKQKLFSCVINNLINGTQKRR